MGNKLDTPSPLFLDSPEPSTSPPPYRSSPLHPPMKRAQPETGHWSSISNRHQHKHHGVTDSPPSSSSEEDTPSHDPKSWLLPRQNADQSLFEFCRRPQQHQPIIDECSIFQLSVQCQSAHIPISRVLLNNTYGDRAPIHIECDLE